MSRRTAWSLILALVISGAAGIGYAQPGLVIQPNRPAGDHQVTVVNGMGAPVRVKITGFRRDAEFARDFQVRGSETHKFFSGERVVTVWSPDQQLIFAAVVPFNRAGTLVLRSPGRPRDGQPRARGGDNARGGLPSLSIE